MEGPIADAERTRFIWYAQHIRTLHMNTAYDIDPTVFLHLASTRLGTPLAPHLRAIYAITDDLTYLDMAITLLAGPALRTLGLALAPPRGEPAPRGTGTRHWYAPRALLADLSVAAPALEHLVVCTCAHASLLEPIGTIRGLRKLDLYMTEIPFDVRLLRALARLKELEELKLPNTFDVLNVAQCHGFKNLRKLDVVGGARTVPALLNSLPDLRLRELCLGCMVCEEMAPLEAVAAALRAGCGEDLEQLCLRNFTAGPALSEAPLSTVLEPFFALKGIRRFTMDSDHTLNTRNDDLRKIGSAWPKLQRLSVEHETAYAHKFDAPTIRGIVLLANKCTGLDGVYFTAVVPTVNTKLVAAPLMAKEFRNTALKIQVPDERIRDVGQMARVLHSAFGKLQIIDLDKGQYQKWSAVLDQMEGLQRTESA